MLIPGGRLVSIVYDSESGVNLGPDAQPEVDHCVEPRTAATFNVHCVTLHRNKSHQNKLHERSSFVSCEPHSTAMTLHYAVIETGVSKDPSQII
jgi:hypothetical protein